jgi:hypothetical protein
MGPKLAGGFDHHLQVRHYSLLLTFCGCLCLVEAENRRFDQVAAVDLPDSVLEVSRSRFTGETSTRTVHAVEQQCPEIAVEISALHLHIQLLVCGHLVYQEICGNKFQSEKEGIEVLVFLQQPLIGLLFIRLRVFVNFQAGLCKGKLKTVLPLIFLE